jgi:hypothetical protein
MTFWAFSAMALHNKRDVVCGMRDAGCGMRDV